MALQGDLSTMGLEEVLHWLAESRRSGVLLASRDDIERSFQICAAVVTSSTSNIEDEQLGRLLVDQGVVEESSLEQAFAVQADTGVLFGKILLMIGAVEEPTLRTFLENKITDAVSEVMSWRTGTFLFDPAAPETRSEFAVAVPITECIERARQTDERRRRLATLIPSMETRFWFVPGDPDGREAVPAALAASIAAGESVREIARSRQSPRLETAEELFALVETGIIAVERRTRPRRATDSPPSLDELEEAAWARVNGDDLLGALDIVDMVQSLYESDPRSQPLLDSITARVVARACKELLSRGVVPMLQVAEERLEAVSLDEDERAAAASVDGYLDLWSLIERSPLGVDRALLAFYRLFKREVVTAAS